MILDFLLSIAIGLTELFAIITLALLIQGITYQLTGFSIYKYLTYNLVDRQLQK